MRTLAAFVWVLSSAPLCAQPKGFGWREEGVKGTVKSIETRWFKVSHKFGEQSEHLESEHVREFGKDGVLVRGAGSADGKYRISVSRSPGIFVENRTAVGEEDIRHEYRFDQRDSMLQYTRFIGGEIAGRIKNEYDHLGRLFRETYYDESGDASTIKTYSFANSRAPSQMTYWSRALGQSSQYQFVYDSLGRIREDGFYRFYYDDLGRLRSRVAKSGSGSETVYFDSLGNEREQLNSGFGRSYGYRNEYEYDSHGNWIKQTQWARNVSGAGDAWSVIQIIRRKIKYH